MFRILPVIFGSAFLIAIVAWSAAALVPACGAGNRIAGTWFDWCPVNKARQTETQLAALEGQNRVLLNQMILQRERELALTQCEPVPQQAALPTPAPLPEKTGRAAASICLMGAGRSTRNL